MGLAAVVGGAIKGIWVSMTPEQQATVASAGIQASQKGIQKIKERNEMRDEKRQRLFGREGRIREALGTRDERRARRQGRRQNIFDALTRPSAGQVSGNAAQGPAVIGQNLPGPGGPGSRATAQPGSRRAAAASGRMAASQGPSYDVVAWYTNPIFWVLGGGAYLLFFRKKK